jgi:copper homeostasis protein CutC
MRLSVRYAFRGLFANFKKPAEAPPAPFPPLTPASLKAYADAGATNIPVVRILARDGFTPADVKLWVDAGVTRVEALEELAARGFSPEVVKGYIAAGAKTVELIDWLWENGLTPELVKGYVDAGVTNRYAMYRLRYGG